MAKLLLGKPIADQIYETISQVATQHTLKLATVGFSAPQWQQYVSTLSRSAERCGIIVENHKASENCLELCNLVHNLCANDDISGVLLQQPLDKKYQKAIEALDVAKDVDCLSPLSVAKLYLGEPCLYPATPLAVLKLLDFYDIDLCGKNVVILGRGNAVGKPLSLMCLQRNATVTVCHTKTLDIAGICQRADIIISACGVANLVQANFVSEHTVVVDVGLSFVGGKTCGDVALDAQDIASAASPVPGGIGPVTRAVLLNNVAQAYLNRVRN